MGARCQCAMTYLLHRVGIHQSRAGRQGAGHPRAGNQGQQEDSRLLQAPGNQCLLQVGKRLQQEGDKRLQQEGDMRLQQVGSLRAGSGGEGSHHEHSSIYLPYHCHAEVVCMHPHPPETHSYNPHRTGCCSQFQTVGRCATHRWVAAAARGVRVGHGWLCCPVGERERREGGRERLMAKSSSLQLDLFPVPRHSVPPIAL